MPVAETARGSSCCCLRKASPSVAVSSIAFRHSQSPRTGSSWRSWPPKHRRVGVLSGSDRSITLGAARLTGTDGGTSPFWSPDSKFVAFFADDRLKKSASRVGAPPRWPKWPEAVSEVPGTATGLLCLRLYCKARCCACPTPVGHADPRHAAGCSRGPWTRSAAVSAGRPPLSLFRGGGAGTAGSLRRRSRFLGCLAEFSPRARWLDMRRRGICFFSRKGGSWPRTSMRIDSCCQGGRRRVAESVAFVSPDGRAAFDVSETGTLVYRVSGIQAATQPRWIDRSGNERRRSWRSPATIRQPSLSPDGSRLAVELHDLRTGAGDLWIVDLVRGRTSRLTYERCTATRLCGRRMGARLSIRLVPTGGATFTGEPSEKTCRTKHCSHRGRERIPKRLVAGWAVRPVCGGAALGREICGHCRCRSGGPFRSCVPSSTKRAGGCLETGDGWHTSRTRAGAQGRCM